MPRYIRAFVPGGTFFFTVVLLERHRRLLIEHIDALRGVFAAVRARRPFSIDAMVVLPDHLHCIWTLPEGDADFSKRWHAIKSAFSRGLPRERTAVGPKTRKRRTWDMAAPVLGAYDPRRAGL